jgi:hypothetical protein
MGALAATLGDAVDPARFAMAPGYDYSDCGGRFLLGCPERRSLPDAARRLASYVHDCTELGPPVILLCFSLGALSVDARPAILREMAGDLRGEIAISPWLESLIERWSALTPERWSGTWLAVSGGFCQTPWRTLDFCRSIGCPEAGPASDGVICAVSAEYSAPPNGPTRLYHAAAYAHSRGVIIFGFSSGNRPTLSVPRPGDELTSTLVNRLNEQAGAPPAPPQADLPLARLA